MVNYEKNAEEAAVDGIQLKLREERVEDKMKLSSKRKLSHMFDSIRLSHEAHGIKIKKTLFQVFRRLLHRAGMLAQPLNLAVVLE